jgi:YrbI family 3-deoxy-D-manno-octulosonate 8-phosphate phosphatase
MSSSRQPKAGLQNRDRRGCVAIIPARGGSKGIPRKNIQPVAGRPLLAYTIEHALCTPEIARVIVSTDDEEIALLATECGAEVILRPSAISGDAATSESALLHVLDVLRESEGYEPELVVFLQATSPLRAPDDTTRCIETLIAEEADSLFSACPVHGFVWRREREGAGVGVGVEVEGGEPHSLSYDYRHRPRRQDAPEDLIENGSIYVFRPSVLREGGSRLGGRIAVHLMDPVNSFQVDEPADLRLMELLLATREQPHWREADAASALGSVRLLALDFDGVMTDNRVYVSEDGREAVACNRGDGWGIARLHDAGVEVAIISTEANPVVAARARKLKIACAHGCDDKLSVLLGMAAERGLDASEIAFVGNDANDLPCLRWVGLPIVVADAEPVARSAARLVTSRRGGRGAVREVADWILSAHAAAATVPAGDASTALQGGGQ